MQKTADTIDDHNRFDGFMTESRITIQTRACLEN